VIKRPKESVSGETISRVLFLNLPSVENLRATEKALRKLKRKDVDTEKAWKKLVEKKFGIYRKPDSLTWKEYYRIKENEAEERAERIRKQTSEIDSRAARQQEERKTKVISQPTFPRSGPAPKRRRTGSTSRVTPARRGGFFAPTPTQSILPKRRR